MKIKGWKNILSFNYIQYVKTKAFIVSTVIISLLFALIIGAVNIIPMLASDDGGGGIFGGEDDPDTQLETLYIYNATSVPTDNFSDIENAKFKTVFLEKEEFDKKSKEIAEGSKAELSLMISEAKNDENELDHYELKIFRPENQEVISESYSEAIAELCSEAFQDSVLLSLGVSKEDLSSANLEIYADTEVFGKEQLSMVKQIVKTVVPMFTALIMFSFIISYAQIIAQSVAQEKTSRVIELLITSVRPLAIIVGKVLAMLLVALTQVAIIGTVSGITAAITIPLGFFGRMGEIGNIADIGNAAGNVSAAPGAQEEAQQVMGEIFNSLPGLFNPASIIAIIITVLLGFVFYALLAGLVGAGISRMEDLASGMQPLMMIAMVGFMLSYMSSAFNEDGTGNAVMTISRYIPISSPFALPAAIIMGEMTAAETAISIIILAILAALTALLVAKVYESIILYSGTPLKLGQMIKMAKNHKEKNV